MQLTQPQATIANDKHRFRVVNCGRRFGKTTLAVEEIIGCALSGKNKSIAYVAPTYQQARDIAWEMLKKRLNPVASKINESRLEIEVMTQEGGKSKVSLRGWESIETLRGQRFDFIIIDEVASMRNFWINWQEVLRPTLTDTRGQVLFISTPKGFNHFYDLFNLQDKDSDFKSFHFTSYDNHFLPVDELNKAKEQMTDDRFAQEYLADFRKTEGLVYKEFNRDTHIIKDLPKHFNKKIAGLDFGYTNPYALLVIGVDYDNNYWVLKERYETHKTNNEIVEVCNTNTHEFKISHWYPDPAEPDRIEEMKRAGLNCREVSKDVLAGIDYLRELFKSNRLKIHRDCINLIQELEVYHFKEEKPEKNTPEEPVKENDHALDALRYALFTTKKSDFIKQVVTIQRPIFKYGR